MASKIVTRRQTTASAVEAAAATHAAEVSAALATQLDDLATEGEAPIDLEALQLRLGRVLQFQRQAMEAADSAHIEELRDDIGPRERRDAAVAALHDRVSRVRGTVETVFGTGASLKLFAIRGLTSRNPEVLRRQAEHIMDRLRDESKPLPEPDVTWLAVDPAAWLGEIEPAHAELVAALRDVYADRRRAEVTFRLKQEALDTHNRTYVAVTSILSGLYRLAGLDAYEQRLRPTVPQGTAVDDVLLEDEPLPEGTGGEDEVEAPPAPPLEFPQAGGQQPAADEGEAAAGSVTEPAGERSAA
jgi:hypothetical protein